MLTVRPYLDFLEQLWHLVEIEPCVNGTVNTLHRQRLVGSQSIQVRKVWLWWRERKVMETFRNITLAGKHLLHSWPECKIRSLLYSWSYRWRWWCWDWTCPTAPWSEPRHQSAETGDQWIPHMADGTHCWSLREYWGSASACWSGSAETTTQEEKCQQNCFYLRSRDPWERLELKEILRPRKETRWTVHMCRIQLNYSLQP